MFAEKFMKLVSPEPNSGCWLWMGYTSPAGYGVFAPNAEIRNKQAHRVAYELFRGPIPSGLVIDHLCRMRCCVNPDHLEPVTQRVNSQRGTSGAVAAARMRAKTHCPYGHPYSTENTLIEYGDKRRCRTCRAGEKRRNHRGVPSPFRGVTGDIWARDRAKTIRWSATCQDRHLGTFDSETEAASAYNAEALRVYGERAILNNLEQPEAGK